MGTIIIKVPHGTPKPFRFTIGHTYLTQRGKLVRVVGRTRTKGYECLNCSDGAYRYDRSTGGGLDDGRCTGTGPGYSNIDNFVREDRIPPFLSENGIRIEKEEIKT